MPSKNSHQPASAHRAAFIIDGEAYFRALYESFLRAQQSIFIVGWDLYSDQQLIREETDSDYPACFGQLLDRLAAEKEALQVYLLCWDFAMIYALEREIFRATSSNGEPTNAIKGVAPMKNLNKINCPVDVSEPSDMAVAVFQRHNLPPDFPPVEEPPNEPTKPPVEEPGEPYKKPPIPEIPPVEEPWDVPKEPPVKEPPPEDPDQIPPAAHASRPLYGRCAASTVCTPWQLLVRYDKIQH